MIRILLWTAMAVGLLIFAGCGMIFVARSHDCTPTCCYDCLYRGVWHVACTCCEYYHIKVVHGGYYYRPHQHRPHAQFAFREHNMERDKQVREGSEKDNNYEKDTKPNREKDSRTRGGLQKSSPRLFERR